jgi:hypothetical protein
MKGYWIECREEEMRLLLWEGPRKMSRFRKGDRENQRGIWEQSLAILYGWA